MEYKNRLPWSVGLVPLVGLLVVVVARSGRAEKPAADAPGEYAAVVQPLVRKYCLGCHSTKVKKGSLDLERFATLADVRKDLKPWQTTIEMLEAGEMPPRGKPRPTAQERKQLIDWTRGFLDAEARARAGDPGYVPLRRLSNAEYDYTVRDLTGVDLRPTREFPADGAGGEGFTNAAEALSDVSPALLGKYLNAAKSISEHAVLLPDGFRFSPGKTRRDWTDESLEQLRRFYSAYPADGRLPLLPYLTAMIRDKGALKGEKLSPLVSVKNELSPKYLGVLRRVLTDKTPTYPLARIRSSWWRASESDVAALAADVAAWQRALWKVVPIGSYRYGNTVRQVANNPAAVETQTWRVKVKPAPGQSDVVLYLVSRDLAGNGGSVVWHRPRLEGAGKTPLLLRDYAKFGADYEVDLQAVFADSARYLAAAVEAANARKESPEDVAKKHALDAEFLKRWIEVLAIEPRNTSAAEAGRQVPIVPLELLGEKTPKNDSRPAINGWRHRGADLPVLITNASDTTEHVPGKVPPHKVTVHPTPARFVAAAWKSPIAGEVRVAARVAHAHPACGNGVVWWLEHRRADRAGVLAEGALDRGGAAQVPHRTLKVGKGDMLLLVVDARDREHSCDMTEIALTVTETDRTGRVWDLAGDVADNVQDGNPHADRLGNKAVWSFVSGPARPAGKGPASGPAIPAESVLGRWRQAVADARRETDAVKLAEQVQRLLSGPRPAGEKHPDRILYDNLVSVDSPLLRGPNPGRLGRRRPWKGGYGLKKEPLVVPAAWETQVRLPAALFRDREFVVEGKLDTPSPDRAVQFQVLTAPPAPDAPWDGTSPVVASSAGAAYKELLRGYDEFRSCFPMFVCYPRVIPNDEVVCLKMYHREDEPLSRLFLDDEQKRRIDRLWEEHRFISRQPVAEHKYLPQFIGFVTQDQPKELLDYFESQREPFRKRAEAFEKDEEAAVPRQMEALLAFAARAYRRPLVENEKAGLPALYQALRKKGVAHEEAFRGTLARVLVAPAFLFRIEQPPTGKEPGPVNDGELATRLSYFLWSSLPDDELRQLAAAGRLRDEKVLVEQSRRMLRDPRVRRLAIEFGAQWVHVRGFDELREKNEKLFPTFDAALRKAIYEESILFFQDLFQSDRAVTQVLDADYTFLDETLAKHYGIPGVTGPAWRRVEGVRKYGRGGILGLASVQARQSGASRTSPVLRGNWVVETLLGEKLPRPPADVPRLPEEEGSDGLTTRQMVEKHARVAECAVCHRRIDPFGFALEHYDPIGRRRDRDTGGRNVDSRAVLKDGTQFDGIDGLRTYLLTRKKDVIVRLFCRKLLGYALGRSVSLSDQALVDEMMSELDKNEGRLSAAVLAIVRSRQFRSVRGSEFAGNDRTTGDASDENTLPRLPAGVPPRRRRDDGAAVAGVGLRVGGREGEGVAAAGAVRLPVRRQRLPQQGVVGKRRRDADGAGQGPGAAPALPREAAVRPRPVQRGGPDRRHPQLPDRQPADRGAPGQRR